MKLLVCIVLVPALVLASQEYVPNESRLWEMFKIEHNKAYKTLEEEVLRKMAFSENLKKIYEHNLKYTRGEVSYKAGINKYSDLTLHEAASKLHSCNRKAQNSTTEQIFFDGKASDGLARNVDWRKKGAVTNIKDQQACGSCWAFAATGSLEGVNFLKTGNLITLSEQNLVDCDKGDKGCGGGTDENAYDYIIKNGGIDTEASYPYTGKDGQCRYDPKTKGASVQKYISIPSGDEEQLKKALATVGPIAVALDARGLGLYKQGIYSNPECSSQDLGHAVLLVGYGTTDKGEDYWLLKNSWGTSWGMSGYFMLARNKNNMCGVATDALFPVVA